MSISLIRRALEKRLDEMTPALSTAYENVTFVPAAGVAYQRVNLLPATPDNSIQGSGTYFEIGIFQVLLCYPQGDGPAAADARAQLLRAHFKRGNSYTEGSVMTLITDTPRVSPAYTSEDRYCIPVTVPWQAQITT